MKEIAQAKLYLSSNRYILCMLELISNKSIKLTPFSSCVNEKFLIRAWDASLSNHSYWVGIDWIVIDQQTSTATIVSDLVNKIGTTIVGFQAQKFYFTDPKTSEYLDISTELITSTIQFINDNPKGKSLVNMC